MFSWVMRHGSRILFAISLPYFLLSLLQFVAWILQMAFQERPSPVSVQNFVTVMIGFNWLYALSNAAMFLFGSMVVERFDRWLAAVGRSSEGGPT